MKYIFMDTNSVNEDGSYYIWDEDVKSKHLKAGDAVIAYQEKDCWDAEIVVSADGYGVVLTSEAKEISDDRFEGHTEGFDWGMSVQKHRAITVLEDLGVDSEIIDLVKRRLG